MKKFIFAAALLIASAIGAFAFSGSGNGIDPFTDCQVSVPGFDVTPNSGIASKTYASPKIDTTKVNVVVLIAGQSLGANVAPTGYTPTNTGHVFNIDVEGGANYAANDPLLGTSNGAAPYGPGNIAGRIADDLINAGTIQNVYLVPMAIGGTSIADWSTGNLGSGCALHSRFQKAYNRLAALGIVPGLTNTTFAIYWTQGEAEGGVTSRATYSAALNSVIAASRTAGFTQGLVPWFVNTETWSNGTTWSPVQLAQGDVVSHPANVWAGFNMDSLNATFRQADNTHLNDTGMATAATGVVAAFHASGISPF